MSDCFDHTLDAFESYDRSMDEGYMPWGYPSRRGRSAPFNPDPLHYHTLIYFQRIEKETQRAFLVRFEGNKGRWIPKSICRRRKDKSMYVHATTYYNLKSIDLPASAVEDFLD